LAVTKEKNKMGDYVSRYVEKLASAIRLPAMQDSMILASWMAEAWQNGNTIYFCGNGGSAGNAIHLANDFTYGAGKKNGRGIRVEALSANPAVVTCLANDVGYEAIYSEQLKVKANPRDILVVLSGSGNSPNVVKALEVANNLGVKTCAILGYSGGKCKELAQLPIHFAIDDMQIAEDLQLSVGHICMQWLADQKLDS
jgi:D-sedoheptulose 7-phosphate isomerase